MRTIFILLSLFICPFSIKGQDTHYSQNFKAPVLLNSAFTGVSNAKFRMGGIYRSQWKVLHSPYESYHVYFDKNNEKFSYGFILNQNNAGNAGLKTTNILLSFSFKKQLGKGDNLLSFGAQAGMIQQRFDLSKLTFDNQYNPEKGFDSTLENGENFQKTSIFLPDLNVGLNWRFSKQIGLPIKGDLGLSFSHVNTPKSSFLNENIHIPLKSSLYGKAEFELSSKMGIEPFLIFTKQGIASEFVFGLNTVFHFNDNALKLGIGNRAKDALILMASFSFNNFELDFSYDTHFQDFGGNKNVGSMEISLTYLFGSKSKSQEQKEIAHEKEEIPLKIDTKTEASKNTNSVNDYDGDGINDDQDLCPYESGMEKFKGCNDRDEDGVWDNKDACPSLPGTIENYGCPYKNSKSDSDDDGVLDEFDDCIFVKGLAIFNGCPDSDGDGTTDHLDECPYLKGPKELNGCPSQDGGNTKKRFSNDFIEFATNSSKISSKYYPFLDRLAFQIKNNEHFNIIIEGHTDEEGDHLYNYHLSQQRAHTVQNYFFQKGIPLEQVDMHFYGETKPKIDKDTEFAKSRNRRVELVVIKTK